MSDGDRVPPEAAVLRVLKDKPIHVRPDRLHPQPAAFEPSSADLAHAPVRVSVWDEAITAERAVALRGGGEMAVYRLEVAGVESVAARFNHRGLRVVEDPGGAVGCAPDEARWHYGIEGLERAAWASKVDRAEALALLALWCEPVE